MALKETRAPCATEYRVFHRPADIQSLTGLQRPARRWVRRLGVWVHLRLLLQGALYVQGEHGLIVRGPYALALAAASQGGGFHPWWETRAARSRPPNRHETVMVHWCARAVGLHARSSSRRLTRPCQRNGSPLQQRFALQHACTSRGTCMPTPIPPLAIGGAHGDPHGSSFD